jgi:hypothetical protein
MVLTRPANAKPEHRDLLARLTAPCPETTNLTAVAGGFAELVTPHVGNADRLSLWTVHARAVDLPHLHACTRGAWRGTATP